MPPVEEQGVAIPPVCHWVARALIIPRSPSALAARKDARKILVAVPSRIWKIAFRNFAIACSEKVGGICKTVGRAVPAGKAGGREGAGAGVGFGGAGPSLICRLVCKSQLIN